MTADEFRTTLKRECDLFALAHGPVQTIHTNDAAQILLNRSQARIPGAVCYTFDGASVMCCVPGDGIRVELWCGGQVKMLFWTHLTQPQ